MRIESYTAQQLEESFGADDLKPGVLLVSPGPFAMAHFLCPCGCGVQYDLSIGESLTRSGGRGWDLTITGTTPTISPSVWNRAPGQCGSHFFIRAGKVVWA